MSRYDDYEDVFDDGDDEFGTPPEYAEIAENKYIEEPSAVLSDAAGKASYLDYDPGVFDDDADGDPTPPDSGRGRESCIPRFNTEEAAIIANQLNELIETRGSSADSASRVDGPASSPPQSQIPVGSALSAVRTRSGGDNKCEEIKYDPTAPSDKAIRSFERALAVEEAESKSGGGLSHRQTLKALKARKEGERERARSRKIVVEGEEPAPFARSSRRQLETDDAKGPIVRQLARKKTAKELKAEAEEIVKAEETEEEKEKRRAAHRARKTRTAEMLASLQKAKADEAEERRKKEAAQKKRKAILTARVIAEASERTAMAMHDKERYKAVVVERHACRPGADEPHLKGKKEAVSKAKEDKEVRKREKMDKTKPEESDSEAEGDPGGRKERGRKISAEQSDALFNRLKARQQKTSDGIDLALSQTVPARDFADWKRKNNVPTDGLVFAMTGWYPCVKQELLDRGWYHNSDPESPFFDLKWTLRSLQTDQEALQPWQLTNHFLKNMAITTKVGLLKSLRSLNWLADVGCNDVIPRGYDLSNDGEMQAFIDDYRVQHAEILLKGLYKRLTQISFPPTDIDGTYDLAADGSGEGGLDEVIAKVQEVEKTKTPRTAAADAANADLPDDAHEEHKKDFKMPKTPRLDEVISESVRINDGVFDTCCSILERYLRPTHDSYIDTVDDDSCMVYNRHAAMSSLQWEVISTADMYASHLLPQDSVPQSIDSFLPGNEHMLSDDAVSRTRKAAPDRSDQNKSNATQQREARAKERREKVLRADMGKKLSALRPVKHGDLSRMHRLLNAIYCCDRNQSGLNGSGDIAKNIWIVKPGAKSRGRGICTFADLKKLLKYVDAGTGSAQSAQWVVQKYMENPLCIANHKFDLRQWVLVTDWNPLTVWFYDECYARFSVEAYTTKDSDLENSYVHLVNNSVSKNSEEYKRKIVAENGENITGFMWSHEQISGWIEHQTQRDLMEEKIKPRMMDIAKWSLMCASECIEHRKNSWELYGFDFMVDDNYNTWLIEINSSPACDYSTPVTERYVQKALVELLKVTLDMREWEAKSKKKRGDKPDTGGWSCIHKGPLLEMPTAAFGADMSLKGDGLKAPKRRSSTSAPPSQPFSHSAKRAAANAAAPGDGNGNGVESPSRTNPVNASVAVPPVSPSPKRHRGTQGRALRVPRSRSVDDGATDRSVDDEGSLPDNEDAESEGSFAVMGTSPSKKALMRGSLDLSQASIMNDSIGSLGDSQERQKGYDDSEDEKEEKREKDREKAVRSCGKSDSQVLGTSGLGPGPALSLSSRGAAAAYRSPLTQQVLLQQQQLRQHQQAAAAAHKFKLDFNMVAPGSYPVDTENLAAQQMQQMSMETAQLGLGVGARGFSPGTENSLVLEKQRTQMLKAQAKEMRQQRAASSSKTVPVPPVGRNSAAIKAKVFDLPF